MANLTPRLALGEPVVVARGPRGLTRWGPWQFPAIERLADGRLHVSFHIEADSAKAYGLPAGHAVSSDNGKTWQSVSDVPPGGGLLLANGDLLRAVALRSRPLKDLSLPPSIATRRGSYGGTYHIYRLEDLPADLRDGWHVARCKAGQTEWIEEVAHVELPGEIRYATEGVFTFPWFWRLRRAPDDSLWAMTYPWRAPGGVLREKWLPVLLRSTDHGYTWHMHGEIPYHGDPSADAAWDRRDGFTEPNIAFLPDGSLLCFLRTTDGNGVGPMYVTRSTDNGLTWDTARVFDDRGVWPAVAELACGVTLVAYGRPGVFVRATNDPRGHDWANRVTVVEPGELGKDSCSYTDLLVLDDRTVLLAYSDFQYPDAEGQKRKTILVRTIRVIGVE